ncbi:MAG: outer membrane protein transport protein [Candidatus Palauibacterales bacterium]|nr:outer membrane protein transport protein [Candidatus Palauibacterales bacterium]MDP2583305.1 outer membrane protein transport protein [Candidatus Palauibacterales bacterium]
MSASPSNLGSHPPGRFLSLLPALLLLLASPPAAVRAQGFGVYEQSTCAMGAASAVVARPCDDGSAMFFNPAALGAVQGLTLSAGVTGIVPDGRFTADLNGAVTNMNRRLLPVPHAYVAYGFGDRFAVGLGLYTPYGLETSWPDSSAAAFLGYESKLHSFYLQPTASVRLTDRISIGAGLTVVLSTVELNQLLDLSTQPVPAGAGVPAGTLFGQLGVPFQTPFASGHLGSSTATGVGGNFGVRIRLTDRVDLGARYLTRVTLNYDGQATFAPVSTGLVLPAGNPYGVPAGTPMDAVIQGSGVFQGPLGPQGIKTSITMPDQFAGGLSVRPIDGLRLEADYLWTHWSLFGRLPIQFQGGAGTELRIEDYNNTSAVRVGGELTLRDGLMLRLGYAWNQAASPDKTVTPLLPEGRRSLFAAGLGWHAGSHVDLNVAYNLLLQVNRRGRTRDPLPGVQPTAALNNGEFHFLGHLLATTVTVHF